MIQKNFKKICLVILTLLITFSTFSYAEPKEDASTPVTTSEIQPRTVEAISETSDAESDTKKDSKEDDVFFTGTEITIDQEIHGNVYVVASNSVTITAPIYGNAFIFSNKVDFKSSDPEKPVYVSDSAYIYGTDISLSLYCQDLYAYATNSLTINYDSCISRDVRGCTPTFNLYGIVKRNVFIDTNNISLSNEKNEKGLINGNLSYYSPESISVPEDLVVGEINYNVKAVDNTPTWLENLYITIARFICSVIFFFILRRITPIIVNPEKGFILKKFLGTLLSSILTLLIVPALCVLAIYCSTRLVLFSLPVIFVYAAFIVISFFASLIYITGLIQRALKKKSIWISIGILFGLNILLYLLSFITIVALIIGLILIVFGFGLLTQELFKKRTVA